MKKLVAKVGTYEKDGETKNRYVDIGVILSNENGEYALMNPTINLAGVMMQQRIADPQKAGTSVMCSIFDNDRQKPQQQPSGDNFSDFDEKIPF